ncbi:MAG: carbon starvation CstA family protein [Deltaproteobacteria bacterium]|nr:carbon starvation CstA family protein [Deltaproteobacteria bacterium]
MKKASLVNRFLLGSAGVTLPIFAGVSIVLLSLGYTFYGRFVARQYALNDATPTPAHLQNDGVDFVPTKKFYLLGQHFSAIAAAGPIAGPILACQQFGWLPCILWVIFGVIFIGAVHDFSSLVVSVRHRGHSIAEIVKQNIGKRAWLSIMGFLWITLVYVIVAFTDITASTFVGRVEELEGVQVGFERGGAVAAASVLYLLLAIVMGFIQKKWNPPLWLLTVIFVPATLGAVWFGTQISTWLLFSQTTWGMIILVYCFIASLLPVWMLLQPRGYLGGFILYMALILGVIGIFFGGYEIHQEAFKTWNAPGLTGSLFPFLFVTIACGACSGFHGLVCSGTTSKQISKESDCKPVGYGGMLLEGFVAVIALATIMIMAPGDVKGSPGTIYGAGLGRFMTLLIGKENLLFAITFGAVAFSTFVFDTLDVTTRLGRYILQELFGRQDWVTGSLATLATVGAPALFILNAQEGGWKLFWVLFGTSNQLLASLTLLAVTVWLHRVGKRYWFTLIPMIFVMIITFWSLLKQIDVATQQVFATEVPAGSIPIINGIVAVLLFVLALGVVVESALIFKAQRQPS